MLCSKSIYSYFFPSPLPGGKSGFQAGKPLVRGPPSAMPVTSFLAFTADDSLPSISWDSPAAHTRSLGCENGRALQLQPMPRRETTPGIWKCFGPGLVTGERKEGHLAHLKSRGHCPASGRAVRNSYRVFPVREKHHKTQESC